MQLCNLELRIGGSMLHTVPKIEATPAEILILKSLHGDDAVVNVRPTRMDKRSHDFEWDRLSKLYDQGGAMAAPGEESRSVMQRLFPGAVKKLPVALKEIGLGHLMSPASIKAAEAAAPTPAPEPPVADEEVELDVEADVDDDDAIPAEVEA